jgi:AraC family transcriptional regulator, regulatory protein of adaptative response / DNA-3-methyladenine glycosylase II
VTTNPAPLDPDACYRAIASRDRRFDGRFVLAVRTTRVYCRPGCPAPLPKRVNSIFYPCAAAAEGAGYRPCRRCRPESVAGTPAWSGTSATVSRALRLILDGALDERDVEALAERVGVGGRHLRRLFAEHLGASPEAVARTRRVHFARRLIDETSLPIAQLSALAGFASLRGFNHAVKATFGRSPTELRRRVARAAAGGALALRLPYRPPFDWDALVGYFRVRATPGVESVDGGVYRRTFALGKQRGVLSVAPIPGEHALRLEIPAGEHLLEAVTRASRVFDLDADPSAIGAHLSRDPVLAPLVARRPGLRVPGGWHPFELTVRAILGQQVSVRAATTLCGRLAAAFGDELPGIAEGPSRLFPEPAALAGKDLTAIGLPTARARAISALAEAVASGRFLLEPSSGLDAHVARFAELPGVGPWTAHYVALRAFHEPDAFPAGDLGLRKAAGEGMTLTERELCARAEAWRPFRAYAAVHLWTYGNDEEGDPRDARVS